MPCFRKILLTYKYIFSLARAYYASEHFYGDILFLADR